VAARLDAADRNKTAVLDAQKATTSTSTAVRHPGLYRNARSLAVVGEDFVGEEFHGVADEFGRHAGVIELQGGVGDRAMVVALEVGIDVIGGADQERQHHADARGLAELAQRRQHR
jgi:hypothetical protein